MLDTSNVGFGRVEKILEAFEVERFIKKLVETQTFVQRIWLQIFWEGKFTPHSLSYGIETCNCVPIRN